MKILKISSLLIVLLLASCKKEDNQEAIEAMAGHWHVLSFVPDNESEMSLLAKDVISVLEQRGCDPIEFSFKTDGKVTYTDIMALLNAEAGKSAEEVDCLWQGGLRTGTFDYDYKTLTLNLSDETITFSATLDDEFITVITNSLVIDGNTVSGRLVFKRETGD